MRKLSEYFKAPDASQSQNTSTQQIMQRLDDPEESPLSECPSPTPPPPRKTIANSSTRGGAKVAVVAESSSRGGNASVKADHRRLRAVIPDSEGEETDDSLEDLDLLLKPKATKAVKPEKKAKKHKTELPVNIKPDLDLPTYTFSLDALISEKAKDAEREELIRRTEALLASAEQQEDHVANTHQLSDKGIVDAAVGDEAGGKLLDMLNRREAWRMEYTWYFFERSNGDTNPKSRNAFPMDSAQGWSARMKDPAARHQMFLSGCVQDMCVIRPNLPTEIVSWLLDELVLETRDDLSFAYARALEACKSQVGQLLDCARISDLFELLGATKDAVNPSSPIAMEEASGDKVTRRKHENIWNLKLLVRFFGNVATHLSNAVVETAVTILTRLSFDDMFTSQGDLLIDIEQSIYSLLMSRQDADGEYAWDTTSHQLSRTIITTFTEPKAQVRLLRILPIGSPRTHLFRRRLALAFLFNDHKYLTLPSSQLVTVDDFSRLLEEPQFSITHETDYSKIKASVEILDIAFDDGGAPGGDHSKRVDRVGTALKELSSRIRDTGMASLERTEAKQVIELTQFRLQFAVAKGRKGGSVLEQHFLKDNLGDREGKKQTLLRFGGTRTKK